MSKYQLYEKVILKTTKEETRIIKVMPKGTAGLINDFYVTSANPDRPFSEFALEPIIKSLHRSKKQNECIGCHFIIETGNKEDFCFYSNELIHKYIDSDIRPRMCIKGTEKFEELIKGEHDE